VWWWHVYFADLVVDSEEGTVRAAEVERLGLSGQVADGRDHVALLAGLLRPERDVLTRLQHVRLGTLVRLAHVNRELAPNVTAQQPTLTTPRRPRSDSALFILSEAPHIPTIPCRTFIERHH